MKERQAQIARTQSTCYHNKSYYEEVCLRGQEVTDKINMDTDDTDLRALNYRLRFRKFDDSTCFLCAHSLEKYGSSSEHVIPRWAQRRYNLWDQQLRLLNQTSIPYRYLTVPCCDECNRYRLQPIETSMSSAVLRGPTEVRNLGNRILSLWLGKIFYGILYKELFLLLNQQSSQDGITIVPPDLLREYETHLFFLQQARDKVETVDFSPASLFVFRTQKPDIPQLQWDICDNIETMFIACRMGEVGIIGILQDGGAQQAYEDAYADILDLPLHPVQFRELCAQFSYRSTLATRTPTYATMSGDPHKVFQLPLGGCSLKPLFDEWEPLTYAKYLALYTGYREEMIVQPPDKVMTWLHDESGQPRYIDFKENPFLPAR